MNYRLVHGPSTPVYIMLGSACSYLQYEARARLTGLIMAGMLIYCNAVPYVATHNKLN